MEIQPLFMLEVTLAWPGTVITVFNSDVTPVWKYECAYVNCIIVFTKQYLSVLSSFSEQRNQNLIFKSDSPANVVGHIKETCLKFGPLDHACSRASQGLNQEL